MGSDKNERSKKPVHKGMLNEKLYSNGTSFSWSEPEPGRLQQLIELVTSRGGAIRFGYSRDGNAGSVGVYYGDERDTLYIRPSEDPESVFAIIDEYFRDKPNTKGASPSQ